MLTTLQDTRESSGKPTRRRELDSQIFPMLGRSLNEAATARRVAEVILRRRTRCWGGMRLRSICIRLSWIPLIASWRWTLSRAGEPR
jgi:hypothetical protein